MNQLFWLQVLISFFIGGGIIGLLSYLTEKAPRNLQGIIMPFPSTMLVGFFFVAYINGIETLIESIPRVGYSLMGSMVYALIFFFSALALEKFQLPLISNIFLTWLFSTLGWMIFPILSQSFPTPQIWFSFVVLTLVILLVQPLFLKISDTFPSDVKIQKITPPELIFRMIFAGVIIGLVVIVSKMTGSLWGTIIASSYPASFGSQFMIFQKKYPANFIASAIRTIPLGLFPLITYALTVVFVYPIFGIWIGTAIALSTSLTVAYIVSLISQKILHK